MEEKQEETQSINDIQIINLRMYYRELVEQLANVFTDNKKQFVKYYKKKTVLSNTEFLDFVQSSIGIHISQIAHKDSALFTEDKLVLFPFFKSSELWKGIDEENRPIVWSYLNTICYILLLMKQTSTNLENVSKEENKGDMELMMLILQNLKSSDDKSSEDSTSSSESTGPKLPDSIKSLADEITKEINMEELMSSMNTSNPIEMIGSLMSGKGNNVLTNMIQKVSGTITNKIEKGEINEKKLMSDATEMMSSLFGGNFEKMMKDMQKGAKKGANPMSMVSNMMKMFSGSGLENMMGGGNKSSSTGSSSEPPKEPQTDEEKKKHREELRQKLRSKYQRK
jgi:hypothetical protein